MLDDDALVRAFVNGTLTEFSHRDHVPAAWLLVQRDGYPGAETTMRQGIALS